MTTDDSPALKGLSFKGGKFVTLLGSEVIEPWSNYNQSHSLLFTYAIPFTHTGGLVSYPITDKISVTAGPVMGWDKVASNNNGWSGLGNITYAMSDMVILAANGIWGPEQNNTTSAKRGVNRSTIFPLPSSPHCAPSTARFIIGLRFYSQTNIDPSCEPIARTSRDRNVVNAIVVKGKIFSFSIDNVRGAF